METLEDDSETELESRRILAKKKLKNLVYGKDGKKYRNLMEKIRNQSSSTLSYVNEIRNNIELKSYLQNIIDNITLLLSSKLQLNRRIISLENKMSEVIREYVERTKLDDLTYNKMLRLFSQPTDYGCPARIKIERPQDRWDVEERIKSIKQEKNTIQIEIQNILRRKYREIKNIDVQINTIYNPEKEKIDNWYSGSGCSDSYSRVGLGGLRGLVTSTGGNTRINYRRAVRRGGGYYLPRPRDQF